MLFFPFVTDKNSGEITILPVRPDGTFPSTCDHRVSEEFVDWNKVLKRKKKMKQYQDKLIELSNNICLAICYIWAFEPNISYAKLIKILGVAIEKGYISEDGYVKGCR